MRWILFTTSAAVHFGTEVEFSAVLAQRFPQGGLGVVCGVGEAELANAVLGYWPGSVLYLVDAYIQVYPPPQDKSKGYKSDKHYQLQFEQVHKSFDAMNIQVCLARQAIAQNSSDRHLAIRASLA